MSALEKLRIYLVPGLVLQSVVIGGGYATGRELVEFFLDDGPLGGVLGIAVAGLVYAASAAIAFELARVTRSYDYRRFCQQLLGRGWLLFEIAYLTLLLLILSVVGSAAGEMASTIFGIPSVLGSSVFVVLIGVLTFFGSDAIAKVLASWSAVLYVTYFLLIAAAFVFLGDDIVASFQRSELGSDWWQSGITYAGYNLAILPAVLFSASRLSNRKETLTSGFIAGALVVIPAILFYVALMGLYPTIGDAAVPAASLMSALQLGWLSVIFYVVIYGTLVETGAGLLHAVNERISSSYAERKKALPRYARPLIALSILAVSLYGASSIGIVDLIANGYSALTKVFLLIFVLPLFTIGVWKICVAKGS